MKIKHLFNTVVLTSGIVLITACGSDRTSTTTTDTNAMDSASRQDAALNLKPAGPEPEWGKGIKPEMQVVMEKLASYGDKPIESLSAVDARKNHTPTDAVMDIMAERGILMPAAKSDTTGKIIPLVDGKLHMRIYTPRGGKGPFPVIVYYHGGGFVIANVNVYHASAQMLCEQVGAVVVSVSYRLSPENKFPTAHNDSFAAYEWVTKNAASINGDPTRIAVAGESAGGNLAANMSIMARDRKITMPVHQLLVYPVAQNNMETESYNKYAMSKPLNKAMMKWFVENYLVNMAQAKDPRINLVAANLKGLPPTTIINAEIDPLADDGKMLADKLKAADVKVDTKLYNGVTHEFFGMGLIVPQAKDAMAYAADALKKAFNK